MSRRTQRLGALLLQEIAELLRREVKDPRLGSGLISITDVEVSPDLQQAKVYVSVYGSAEEAADVLAGLASAAGFLRRELRERLVLRTIPALVFLPDPSLERADRILALMRQLSTPHEPGTS